LTKGDAVSIVSCWDLKTRVKKQLHWLQSSWASTRWKLLTEDGQLMDAFAARESSIFAGHAQPRKKKKALGVRLRGHVLDEATAWHVKLLEMMQ